jgi:putative hydrolase of the HAD superfamily
VLDAVLFDWGDTLMRWAPEPEFIDNGHRAGLAAIGRDVDPAITARFRDAYLPKYFAPGVIEEIEYPGEVRSLLREFGIEVSDDELLRFLEAEHAAWAPARQLAATTHALLESLRDRGLKLGLVSNAIDPPGLLHRDLQQLGVEQRLDVAVFSSELGRRKPDPSIFEAALSRLGVAPERALMVGDSVANDIAGGHALGMWTCQALWFVADEQEEPEPDFRAFSQMDVLTAVSRATKRAKSQVLRSSAAVTHNPAHE